MPETRASLRYELASLGFAAGELRLDEPLARHCSWRIGGPADILVEPGSPGQVAAVIRHARTRAIPFLVIGQGTNLLFDDAGLRGVVVKIGPRLSRLEIDGERIYAEAGVWVPHLARTAARAGLSGLEHTIGIPGTLGGLVAMNGGSQRRGIGDNVVQVTIVDREGERAVLNREECRFGYRSSRLQEIGAVVVAVELACTPGAPGRMRQEMLADLRERRRKFPRKGEPNCGSVFLSTAQMHATVGPPGRIIEAAGLKGYCLGGAEISPRHANFIVNRHAATCRDVLALIAHVRRTVREKIGFDLRCEVRHVSAAGEIRPADEVSEYFSAR